MARLFLSVVIGLLALPAFPAVDVDELENELLRKRYQSFIEELRCPKCQNQNLAGSDSMIASDLRRELRRQLRDGRSDKEIVDYMVARYGDFVLYNPPLQLNTLVLWLGPVGFLLAGVFIFVLMQRRTRTNAEASDQSLDSTQQARLRQLLGDEADSDGQLQNTDKGDRQ